MRKQLFNEILKARERVYAMFDPTPLERLALPFDAAVFIKREDLSPIHSYKWRGAYNRMAVLTPEERERGVVCASAGNHAQGVAAAARAMSIHATIYMPRSTPRTKQAAVAHFGGHQAEVVLFGDQYSQSADEAARVSDETGSVFIHPYDDLLTMGGQGTLADEIVMSGKGPFDIAYVQIGGGGMAASVACWLKTYYPNITIVGVEGDGQACMAAALLAGKPVALDYVDVFADGTAVQKAGELTYPLCKDLIDEFITVSNEELCAAIQVIWESVRCIPEPSGAMGLAGLMKQKERVRGHKAICIVTGSNLDFGQLAYIARHAKIGASRCRYFQFEIEERGGSLLALLELISGVNIVEMQYGKTDPTRAWPVIGLEASPMELEVIAQRLADSSIRFKDVTGQEDVEFRIIHYEPDLFTNPYLFRLEFPERAGALRDFMRQVKDIANMCYFNYVYSGERIGRALLGFEFETEERRNQFLLILNSCGLTHQEISIDALKRILGR